MISIICRVGKIGCQILLLRMVSVVRHLQWNHEHSILAESANMLDVHIEVLTLYHTNVQLSLEFFDLLFECTVHNNYLLLHTLHHNSEIISVTTRRDAMTPPTVSPTLHSSPSPVPPSRWLIPE